MVREKKMWWTVFATLAATLPALGMINDETVRTLRLTQFVVPEFPAGLVAAGVAEGVATVAIAQQQDRAGDVLVLDTTRPEFAEAALEAVSRWRFASNTPEVSDAPNGHPIIVRFYFSYRGVVSKIAAADPAHLQVLSIDTSAPRLPTFDQLDARPTPRQQPMPEYPGKLRSRALPGTATIEFYIDENGHARVPVVTSATSPEFGEAARQAVSQWSYEPPRQRGRPVIAVGHWQFQFDRTPNS